MELALGHSRLAYGYVSRGKVRATVVTDIAKSQGAEVEWRFGKGKATERL